MDVFRRQKFNEAMFAKNRTLAIRVGQYQSRDINEASFDYGYIKGDTYKPGGTCAGSAKIVFSSVITSFNKLDKIYPEIGLLVDGTYEWVKMGEYFINDIEIDRNRKTTKLDLMDGMFKLNREHVTDLTYPAEIRNVIKEICLKTGIELANENMGLASMNYRIEQIPKDKKMTFRDVLSLATQMLGMSCFFNREGKLEIKELTDSGITITADSYFMHGLTKSEIEYQIAGITCKKDKETLTVGLRTGRSLEIENVLMHQPALDNLYHNIKDIRYYPFSLNYQGHLLLDVGQWVTIKTNTGETFKSPVLSQSFNFKGGLRGRISADSKAGNDAQYSYAGTITKKIEQFSEFEKQLQNQIEEADRGFDAKVDQIKKDFNDQVELAKAKAEENKRALSDEIDRRFHDFSPEGFDEAKKKAEEALKKASASADIIEEAKRIADSNTRDLNAFKTATQRERDKLSSELKQYSREETQTQITQRFQDFTRDNEVKLSEYKQGVDGRFTTLASQIAEKATQGGPNMLRNSRADDELKYWTEVNGRLGFTAHKFYFNGQKRMFELRPGATVKSPRFIVKRSADYTLNFLGFDNNSKYLKIYFCKRKKGSTADFEEKQLVFSGTPQWTDGPVLNNSKSIKKSFKFNVGDFDDGYLQFEYDRNNPNKWGGLFMTELDFYEGTTDRKWQPAPEDAEEGVTQKLAEYKETVDGRFATISSQISGKVDQSDFQRVKETSQLYERILGTTEQGVADNASRLVMSSQIFQTEVKKITESSYNLVYDPTNLSKWAKKQAEANVIEVQAGTKLLRITNTGKTNAVYHGFALSLTTSTFTEGEKLSYRMQAWVDVLPDAPLGIELWAEDGGVIASDRVTFTKTGIQIITGTMTVNKSSTKSRDFPFEVWLMKNGQVAIGQVSLIRGETPPSKFKDDTSAQDVVTQSKVTQLFDSYAIQTLTSAGSIVSQINATNNQILIEAEKIRLKGKTLLDELTAIDGYFKRLFVGDARIGTLNTDIIRSNSISADKLIFDTALAKKLVSSDVFTDTLAAKTAFINKLRSVVVSATLLEGYKGKIGGFQIGTHDKDPSTYWLTGQNQFKVGMGSGNGRWGQTALWVNWGNDWGKPGDTAWFVKNSGEMYCYNQAHFWNTPIIHGNLKVSGNIYYITDDNTKEGGYWIHSPSFKRIQESSGYIYLYRFDNSYSWIPVNKEISDRRYKHNIEDSKVSALEVIDRLKTYSYRKEYDGKVEDISCGIMAQDVQQVAPEAFLENPDGAYSYNTFVLLPYLIKAIQELNQKVERLETTT